MLLRVKLNDINNMNKKIIIGIVVVVVVILAIVFNKNGNTNEIKIGVISSLTGSAATYGEPSVKSALLAQKEINQNGGILGKQVKLIVEDGKCDGATTASAAHKLIDVDHVPAILGGHCSTESLVLAPIAEKAKVVTIASITSSPAFSNIGTFAFRNSPSSVFYTSKAADQAYALGYRKIAALYENKDFPVGVYEAFAKRFTELGGEIISNDAFSSEDKDLRSYILKIDKENPDAILNVAQAPAQAVNFLNQMKQLGLINKYPIIGGAQNISAAVNKESGGLLNNPKIFTTDGFADPTKGKTAEFVKNYTAEYKELPPTNLAYLATSYDALYMIKEAMESCKSDSDTVCMRDYLGNLKDWNGAVGTMTLGKTGDPVTPIGLHYFDASGKEMWKELK
jgi:branched-chain amino acid transport system substrate-binding protein